MEALAILVLIILVVGMIRRKRGDNLIDTFASGCSGCFFLSIILLIVLFVVIHYFSGSLR